MNEAMEFTGERFTPECVREIWYEHLHRYAFAAPLVKGMRVLDAACGEGYGAALLARSADRVSAVDVSAEAVAHARERYGSLDNLSFHEADVTRLPFEDDHFDAVVSFETLEHLEAQDAMLAEFRRVLKPQGFLLVSSPDKAVYTDQQGNDNPFHVRELYREELETLLRTHFPAIELLGQKLMFHSAIWSSGALETVALQQMEGDARDTVQRTREAPQAATYLLALCAAEAGQIPARSADLWLFDDREETVYDHYHGEIRRNMAAGGIIAERDAEIERLKTELEQARCTSTAPESPARRRPWWRRWLGRRDADPGTDPDSGA
ncbi:MAG: methyltransferase domain-containing protein [Xanthomonadales bacterium]|jgi:SAM-dependent methyltransferase|nr:methyltransferase domain-containing protein [Xanthomonadales bacterium]